MPIANQIAEVVWILFRVNPDLKVSAALEAEKAAIEEALCTGTLAADDLTTKSIRLSVLNEELDEKTMRWLELSEIPEQSWPSNPVTYNNS